MTEERSAQLAYSDLQGLMLDETSRRGKARKIASILQHFLGREDLHGLRVVDVGCSGGIVADELRALGADVVGLDIDRPGLAKAHAAFGDQVPFVTADSQRLPLLTDSADVVICNHVYEHVVDAEELFSELRRIVRPEGAIYLGLGNRLGVMEPHYRLPFLSWLPRGVAHRYVRAMGRADHYHEAFRTRRGLEALCAGLHVWDYTWSVVVEPDRFAAGDTVPRWFSVVPDVALRAGGLLIPTFLWVATTTPSSPQGPTLVHPPEVVSTR